MLLCYSVMLLVFLTLEGRICVARFCISVQHFFVNKLLRFIAFVLIMTTGGGSHSQLGRGDCDDGEIIRTLSTLTKTNPEM